MNDGCISGGSSIMYVHYCNSINLDIVYIFEMARFFFCLDAYGLSKVLEWWIIGGYLVSSMYACSHFVIQQTLNPWKGGSWQIEAMFLYRSSTRESKAVLQRWGSPEFLGLLWKRQRKQHFPCQQASSSTSIQRSFDNPASIALKILEKKIPFRSNSSQMSTLSAKSYISEYWKIREYWT